MIHRDWQFCQSHTDIARQSCDLNTYLLDARVNSLNALMSWHCTIGHYCKYSLNRFSVLGDQMVRSADLDLPTLTKYSLGASVD